jgi:hypothetical protein
MKKLSLTLILFCVFFSLKAQKDAGGEFFKLENVFTGGTVNLQFGNKTTALGIGPFIGYSFNKYFDFAVSPAFNYVSLRDYPYVGDKVRQFTYGPGAFVRVFPVRFLFAQAQYEFNFLNTRYVPLGGSSADVEKFRFDAHSVLIGGGIANGKDFPDSKSYYYFSILWDVGKSEYSPYKNNLRRSVPIIRAGYNIALFQGRK